MISSHSQSAQWNEARKGLREWLAEHHKSQSDLARLAGVNRSVISRFLKKDQPLSTDTAAKLYGILKLNPDSALCEQWIEWLNLDEVYISPGERRVFDEAQIPSGAGTNIDRGYYWLNKAWSRLRKDLNIPAAMPLFVQAEQAFGRYSTLAAFAGCEIASQYINLGYLVRAEQELFRVEQTYQNVMDVRTRQELLQRKAEAAYDGRDYERSLQVAAELIEMEKTYGLQTMYQHIAGLSQLAMAERLGNADPERQRLLGMAEENIRFMCRQADQMGLSLHIGYMNLRLAQVLREQKHSAEAEQHLKIVRPIFTGESAFGHAAIEEANLALLNGETSRARARAESAREPWLPYWYATGLGRVSAVTALSLWMEGRAEEALEPAVVAACIAPNSACYKGDLYVDLPWQINRDVRRDLGARQYAMLIAQMQEHVHLQSGHFACLARVVPDRSGAALALLAQLATRTQPSR